MNRTEIIHASIDAPPREVAAFLLDVTKWKLWAPWVQSAARSSDRDWTLATEVGEMKIRFGEPNDLGVLDHRVTLESGVTVNNAMRVIENDTGSELVMVLFQHPTMSTEDFERDVKAVRTDLERIPVAVEAHRRTSSVAGQPRG